LTVPKPSNNKTFQTGTVLKLKRVTFDADYYHINFQNAYSTATDITTGEQVNYLAPNSITQGVEGEANIYLGHGLSVYVNATKEQATYTGQLNVSTKAATSGFALGTPVPPGTPGSGPVTAPSGLWVQQTPTDTEAEGVTYQQKSWDVGIFNKRVGSEWMDNGQYHNQIAVAPFNVTNMFFNYTIHNHSHFDQTKFRLAIGNLFDQHNITTVTPANSVVSPTTTVNGVTVTNPFVGTTAISPNDVVNVLPGRSFMFSVTFGFAPKRS
jgi:iron complex outermembrane receptor protein